MGQIDVSINENEKLSSSQLEQVVVQTTNGSKKPFSSALEVPRINNKSIDESSVKYDDDEAKDKCTPASSDYNYKDDPANKTYKFHFSHIKWPNAIALTVVHVLAVFALYLYVTGRMMWQNAIVAWIFSAISALGVTAGSHRLWCHRSYKAKLPLRFGLT